MKIRVGFASDIHQLVKSRPLILGGVIIPSAVGELAHSDGDVVYHALSEAILGALALGDLGKYFPDTDDKFSNYDSSKIVTATYELMKKRGYKINNVDISITLETPKLASRIDEMRKNTAKLLHTVVGNISIKAGTNEKMDDLGKGKAVKAEAIVSLIK